MSSGSGGGLCIEWSIVKVAPARDQCRRGAGGCRCRGRRSRSQLSWACCNSSTSLAAAAITAAAVAPSPASRVQNDLHHYLGGGRSGGSGGDK